MNVAVVTGGRNGKLGPIWMEGMERLGYQAIAYDLPGGDVTDREKIRMFKNTLDERGLIPTVLINNAAIDNPPDSKATFWSNIDGIIDVNLKGTCFMTEAFVPGMRSQGGGVIVNISSILGLVGADWRNYENDFEKPVAYNASKAGIIGLTKPFATEFGRYNIRCVCIASGPFDAGNLPESFKEKFLRNVPLGRTITKESLIALLTCAISAPELTGTVLLADGGYTAW